MQEGTSSLRQRKGTSSSSSTSRQQTSSPPSSPPRSPPHLTATSIKMDKNNSSGEDNNKIRSSSFQDSVWKNSWSADIPHDTQDDITHTEQVPHDDDNDDDGDAYYEEVYQASIRSVSRDSDRGSSRSSDSDSDECTWSDSDISERGDLFDSTNATKQSPMQRKSLFRQVSFEDQTYTPPGLSGTASMASTGKQKESSKTKTLQRQHSSDSNRSFESLLPTPLRQAPAPMVRRKSRPTSRPHKTIRKKRGSFNSFFAEGEGEGQSSESQSAAGNETHRDRDTLNTQTPLTARKQVVGKQMSMNSANRNNVGVKMKIKLDYIDDVNQEIHTEVFLSMHYKCASAKQFMSGQTGFVALSPEEHPDMWVPMVEFLNFRSCDHIEGFRLLVNTKSGVVYIYRVYRIVFRGLLKLDRFPFDRQIINIELKSFTCRLVPWSMPEDDIPYGIRADVLWRNHDIVVECDGSLWELNWTKGLVHQDTNPSVYISSFGIGRISLFYMINFFLVSFFVVGSTFGMLAINHTDFGTRSSITFTILLTVISTKFIMSSYTPKINYLTWLDYYNLLGMVFVIIIILENYVVSTAPSFSFLIYVFPFSWEYFTVESAVVDTFVPYYMLLAWTLFHVFIFCGWLWGWFYEKWEAVLSKDKQDVARICGDVTAA